MRKVAYDDVENVILFVICHIFRYSTIYSPQPPFDAILHPPATRPLS